MDQTKIRMIYTGLKQITSEWKQTTASAVQRWKNAIRRIKVYEKMRNMEDEFEERWILGDCN